MHAELTKTHALYPITTALLVADEHLYTVEENWLTKNNIKYEKYISFIGDFYILT